jgi:adenylosuccinate synthase
VVIGDRKHTFHLIPSGALKGKELLVGAGVVADPVVLSEELSMLP